MCEIDIQHGFPYVLLQHYEYKLSLFTAFCDCFGFWNLCRP